MKSIQLHISCRVQSIVGVLICTWFFVWSRRTREVVRQSSSIDRRIGEYRIFHIMKFVFSVISFKSMRKIMCSKTRTHTITQSWWLILKKRSKGISSRYKITTRLSRLCIEKTTIHFSIMIQQWNGWRNYVQQNFLLRFLRSTNLMIRDACKMQSCMSSEIIFTFFLHLSLTRLLRHSSHNIGISMSTLLCAIVWSWRSWKSTEDILQLRFSKTHIWSPTVEIENVLNLLKKCQDDSLTDVDDQILNHWIYPIFIRPFCELFLWIENESWRIDDTRILLLSIIRWRADKTEQVFQILRDSFQQKTISGLLSTTHRRFALLDADVLR